MQFQASQFMSAADKARVLKQWQRFVQGGFKRTQFCKDLYQVLHLHFPFIAHYDIDGFYSQRFSLPQARMATLRDMIESGSSPDMADLNVAMGRVIAPLMATIEKRALADSIGALEAHIDLMTQRLWTARCKLSELDLTASGGAR